MIEIISQQSAKGPYSTVVGAGPFVFLSGQGGIDAKTGVKVEGGIRAETTQTLRNISDLLRAANLTMDHLVSITCYLTDINEWSSMNEAYAGMLGASSRPVRTAVEVSGLPFGLCIEMTAVAYRGQTEA
jgi:2-iminobutanoate/2-iminopropanoate deaminase